MKKVLNIALPIIVLAYTFAYMGEHPSATVSHYIRATVALILIGCLAWFIFGLVRLGD